LLIDSNGRVKVADFGFAKIKKADLTKDPYPIGTPGDLKRIIVINSLSVYMAPELMLGKEYDGFKADVYSFGLIVRVQILQSGSN
jgi:serine/threonine protein kinase